MRSWTRPQPWRWQESGGSLVLLRLESASGPEPVEPPPRISKPIIGICVLVAGLGVVMMLFSGTDMLEGDFTSTGTGRRNWATPPIAFVIGLGLALSPYFIVRQERTRGSTRSTESWESALALYPEGMELHEWPRLASHAWDCVSPAVLDAVPAPGRAVVEHYLSHPEDRSELGTVAAVRRADSIT